MRRWGWRVESIVMASVAEHLRRFRQGDHDGPFFALLETNHEIIPELVAAFRDEPEGEVRAFLVEVIWQHRQPSAIPILSQALHDADPKVWKQAMDGLVTLASRAALDALRSARNRHFPAPHQTDEFRSWVEEAIEQVESKLTSNA